MNGYTNVAPSYYLTPPVVDECAGYVAALINCQPAPAYLVQPAPAYVVHSAPGLHRWPRTSGLSWPSAQHTTEVEYTLRGPGGHRQKLEIEYNRWGGIKEVEYRPSLMEVRIADT